MLTCSKEQSRQFGFLRFSALEDAEAFMDRNYPILYLYGDTSKASDDPDEPKVRITYGRERRENKTDDSDWLCSSVSDPCCTRRHPLTHEVPHQ